ncbi:UNVERIFIED_CONTAM: hypothetical protein FKN15_038035 [Acipenser sinensis]
MSLDAVCPFEGSGNTSYAEAIEISTWTLDGGAPRERRDCGNVPGYAWLGTSDQLNGVEISHGDTKGDYCATVVDSSRCFTALMSSKDQCRGKAKKLLQRRVKDAMSASAVMFSGYSEHDAHEFLNHCLVQLKEDGKKLVMAGEELQATSLGISLSMYSCPVITNMDFQLQYKMTCTGCGDFSVRRELFTMLSISVVPGCSIQDCLDHYFKTGELCSSYRLISLVSHLGNRVSTGHYISDVYDFLADKWLTYDDEKASETDESAVQAERKCTGYIFFYMHNNGTGTGTPCEGGESSPLCAERVLKDTGELYSSYRLICLVSHLGSQVSTGHYISDVYDFLADKWLTYDDEKASETDESAVQAERKCTGYIFFYMHKLESSAAPIGSSVWSATLEVRCQLTGELCSSYRLISLVSHIGSQVSTAHRYHPCADSGGAKMNTRCPPKRVPSAARFFTHCELTVQPPQSYSVGGQRSSEQLTGARPDYRGRWCAVSRGHPG